MPDEQAVAGEILVPTLLLSVLKDEIFLVGFGGVDAQAHVVIDRLKDNIARRGIQHFGLEPSHAHTLVGREVARRAGIVEVATHVHERPTARRKVAAARHIVEVGKVEHVRIFVANRADALKVVLVLARFGIENRTEFVGAGIAVDAHAVEGERLSVAERLHLARVLPDGVFAAARGLAHAGIEHVDIVHHAIQVAVVLAEVNLSVQGFAGFHHHVPGVEVAAREVLPVETDVAAEHHGTEDIKRQVVLPVAGREEIVAHAARGTVEVEALLVEHIVEELARVVVGEIRGLVGGRLGEGDEDGQCALLSRGGHRAALRAVSMGLRHSARRTTLCALRLPEVGLLAKHLRTVHLLDKGQFVRTAQCGIVGTQSRRDPCVSRGLGIIEKVVHAHQRNTILREEIVVVLIANEAHGNGRAVGLRQHARPGVGGNGKGLLAEAQQEQKGG